MSRVCVLGAGTMGRGIAGAALQAGYATTLVELDAAALERAGEAIRGRAPAGAELELSADLEQAVAGAAVVIEAVPELLDLKQDIFERLADDAPADALLATNTSTMSVTRIAERCANAGRVIGMHFFNPVHRMPLVEVVVGERTSEQTVADALRLVEALGKDPVVVQDVPGFITSRLGLLLGNEAMRIVEDGVASAADVDKAMRLGYRHPMGPLELADLVGLDARLNNLRSMYDQTPREEYRPPAILERLVAAGHTGRKSGSGFYEYDADGSLRGPAPLP